MKEKLQKEIRWLLDEKYGGEKTPAFFDDIGRLNDGEPLDYVIGWKEFLGCRIDLSRRPFIPRSETEFWVKQAIEDIKQLEKKEIRCLDLFAGSGCIGIAVLKHISEAHVDFAEHDEKFLEQMRINLKLNSVSPDRCQVFQSDVFLGVHGRYDYIFANPPYLAEFRKDAVQKSVFDWEPHTTLFGGGDGIFFIKEVLRDAPRFLKQRGKLYMEFDSHEKEAIERLFSVSNFKKHTFFRDQYEQWRYVRVSVA